MADEGKQDSVATVFLLMVIIGVGISLILDYGHGLDINYVNFFALLLGFGLLSSIVLVFIGAGTDGNGYKPTLFDSSDVRPLANFPWSRTIAAGVLLLMFIGGGLVSQSSVIPIVNPYDASTTIAKGSELSAAHNQYATALRSGVYPGVAEDIAGFVITSITTFGLLFLFKRFDEEAFEDVFLFLLCVIIACVLWGFVFASAHSMAYGANEPAFVSAWVYGSTSQFVNQLVGGPVSILAHIGHNFLIVASLSIVACVGALCSSAAFLPWGLLFRGVPVMRKRKAKRSILEVTA